MRRRNIQQKWQIESVVSPFIRPLIHATASISPVLLHIMTQAKLNTPSSGQPCCNGDANPFRAEKRVKPGQHMCVEKS